MSTDLMIREAGFDVADAWQKAEAAFPRERKEQIAQFLQIEAENPAFEPFLAVSAALGLNPILGEIWLIPQSNRQLVNGQWTDGPKKYRPAVGRDGLLSKARRDPSFGGMRHDVVCARDTFRVVNKDIANPDAVPEILHAYAAQKEGQSILEARGPVVGAWCVVYVKGRPPTYFFADVREHAKTKDRNGTKTYEGAWGYTSTMILKAAQSYCLRIGLGVTGVIPADELSDEIEERRADEGDAPLRATVWERLEHEMPESLVAELRELTADWPEARVEMELTARSEEQLREMVARSAVSDAVVVEEPAAAGPLDEDADANEPEPAVGDDEALDEQPEQDRDPGEAPLQERVDFVEDAAVVDADPEEERLVLKHRLDELLAAQSSGALSEDQADEVAAEIDQLSSRLDELTTGGSDDDGEPDGQGALL